MTIAFGDYELSDANDILISSFGEMSGASRDLTVLDTVGVRGVKVLDDTFEGKLVEITGAIECTSEIILQIREFVTELSKQGQPLTITNDEGEFVYDGAYVINTDTLLEMLKNENKRIRKFRLVILCPKGFARSTSVITDTTASITSFPHEDTIIIGGDTNPEPIITITFTDASTIEDLFFTNQTTNQQISVSGITFLDGDILVFDTENKEVRHNAIPIVFDGVFPDFIPGENTYQITVAGSGNVVWDQQVYNAEELLYGDNHIAQSFEIGAGADISQLALLLKRVDASVFKLLDNFNDNILDGGIWPNQSGTFAEEGGELRVGKKGGAGGVGNVNTGGRAGIEGYEIAFSWNASGAEGPDVFVYVQSNGAGASGGVVEARSQHAVNKTTVHGVGGLAGLGTYVFTGKSATLKVEQDGSTVKVYVNGTLRLSGTFSLGAEPIVGLEAEAGSGNDFYIKANIVNEKSVANANGDINVAIEGDAAGEPDGVPLANATLVIASGDVGTAFNELIKAFAVEPTLAGTTQYHAVIDQDGGDVDNYYVLKKQNTDVIANGNLELSPDAGANWNQETEDLYLKIWSTLPVDFDLALAIAYFKSYFNIV